jgi:cobalt-zinc-cadmium resistance protein CzcA
VNATEFDKEKPILKFKKQSGIRNIESISPNCVFAKSRKLYQYLIGLYQNFSTASDRRFELEKLII